MYAGCSSDKDFVQKCEDCQAKLAPHVQDFIMYVPCIVMQLPSKVYCHSQCALAGQEGHQSKCKRWVCIVKGRDKVTAWLKTPSATLIALLKGTKLCSLFLACIWQSSLCTTKH